ncbi:MAG: hypothetical protein EP322_05435 [Bacteroidetes bacterium]|nr:MAG: hypothetical protein EP322_05435 [Bacteroidota bacterium]
MQLIYKDMFESFPDSSRVWIYQSQSRITEDIQNQIKKSLKLFLSGWATHGTELFGGAEIVEDYFIILCVDESKVPASGCSIDTSVRFIKELESKYNLNLFNRLNVLIELGNEKQIVHFSELSNYPEAYVYNPMIESLGDLRSNWKLKIKDSSFA